VHFARRGWAGVVEQLHPASFEFLRPLAFLVFRVELSLFGARAALFHAAHLLMFVLAAALAGRLAGRIGGARVVPWAAALALLYPGRIETVAWIAGLFDLLALILVTAGLLVAVEPGLKERTRAALLLLVAFVAPLAKESAYALPLVLVGWEAFGLLAPARAGARVARCTAALLGSALSAGFRLVALGGVGGYSGTTAVSIPGALVRLPEALVRIVFLPVNPTYGAASFAIAALCAVGIGVAHIGALRDRSGVRLLRAGAVLAVCGLLPTMLYLNPSVAGWDHSRYIALSGLGVALAAAGGLVGERRWRLAAGALLLPAWIAATVLNTQPWLGAARARDRMIAGIEQVTRTPGRHVVWVAGPILDYRGARLLGGRLQEAVDLALPGRSIEVDSEFRQRAEGRVVGPPGLPDRSSLHVFRFDPETLSLHAIGVDEHDPPR
jgi:hypothetical protein